MNQLCSCISSLRFEFAQLGLHRRRLLPLVLGRLVAAEMDVARREQLHHFAQHVLQEGEGAVLDIEQPRVHAPIRRNRRCLAGHAQLRIRGDRRLRMARQVDLRHHGDEALRGVLHDVADLVLRVIAAVRLGLSVRVASGRTGRNAAAAHFGQLRVLPDLDAPALIVGQVPVEGVELVQRHLVEQRLDFIDAAEVARDIEHQSTPDKARRVLDALCGDARLALAAIGGGQLPQRDGAIEQAGRSARGDGGAAVGDIERVGLVAGERGLGIDGQRNPCIDGISGGVHHRRLEPTRELDARRQSRWRCATPQGDRRGHRVRLRVECELTLARLHMRRTRNDRRLRGRGSYGCCGGPRRLLALAGSKAERRAAPAAMARMDRCFIDAFPLRHRRWCKVFVVR